VFVRFADAVIDAEGEVQAVVTRCIDAVRAD
jgi:hypothetical protein